MKKNTTILWPILFYPKLFKIKGSRISSCFIILITIICFSSCKKDDGSPSGGSPSGVSSFGVWQRYGPPNGYNTDLAVGNIPGEPVNRVYMCEHPGSPSAGLYKENINGNIITWDASYGLPVAKKY